MGVGHLHDERCCGEWYGFQEQFVFEHGPDGEHANLLVGMEAHGDPMTAFKDVDYALLVGSRPRGPGMERAELLAIAPNWKSRTPHCQNTDATINHMKI